MEKVSVWCTETDPTHYCTKCLSLNIKKTSFIRKGQRNEGSKCCDCGGYNIKTVPFNQWVELAEINKIKVVRPAKWAIKLSN